MIVELPAGTRVLPSGVILPPGWIIPTADEGEADAEGDVGGWIRGPTGGVVLSDGPGSVAAVATPAVQYGVNTPKFWEASADHLGPVTMYGDDYEAISGDLWSLGVTIARHPNVLQLTAANFDFTNSVGVADGIPLETGGVNVSDQVQASSIWAKIAEVIEFWQHEGAPAPFPKFAFTFLSLGGGWNEWPDSTDAQRHPTPTLWSTEHVGEVDADGNPFDFSGDEAEDRATLGPSSAYKRGYFLKIAHGIARGLRDVATARGLAVEDFVDSIEIGNEVEVRDYVVNVDSDGDGVADTYGPDYASWAQIYVDVATLFRDTYKFSFALKLPAIASSTEGAGGTPWAQKVVWLDNLLFEVVRSMGSAAAVGRVVSAVDLHYYHRGISSGTGDAEAPLYLVGMVREVEDLLGGYTSPPARVTVMELGTGTACSDDTSTWTTGYPSGCEAALAPGGAMHSATSTPFNYDEYSLTVGVTEDFRPLVGLTGVVVGANDFQAQSVWTRFAIAAAAGASAVAWHAPMTPPNDTAFGTMGLRRDTHAESEGGEVAHQRVSFFAVKRFIDLLGGAERVALVLPALPDARRTRGAVGDWLFRRASPDDSVYVVEFVSSSSTRVGYRYLLFIDPIGSTAEATVEVSGERGHRVYSAPTAPVSAAPSTRAGGGNYASTTWYVQAAQALGTHTDPFEVALTRGAYPLLLLSPSPLTFTVASATTDP